MQTQQSNLRSLIPIFFGFFIMGFCDVVGISTSYVKVDFGLSETVAGFLPSMVFIWFLVLSVPAALWMNRIGRKNTVLVSILLTIVGMFIPFIYYSFASCLVAFALLGIGNTILQVSLNPLLMTVVKAEKLSSMLTAGQLVKAISAFLGPFITAGAVAVTGSWQMLFPVFGGISLLAGAWLFFAPIPKEERSAQNNSTLSDTLVLLKDKGILSLFLGIVFIVGVDVGINTLAPKLLMERCDLPLSMAGFGSSIYFALRTLGSFIGALLLVRVKGTLYFKMSIVGGFAAIVALFFCHSQMGLYILYGAIGLFCSSIFSILYAMALSKQPNRANEVSGLMIMGVCGGAIIPPLMGYLSEMMGSQAGSILVVLGCALYLLVASFTMKEKAV